MGLQNNRRAEWEQLLAGHPLAPINDVPEELHDLLRQLDEKLGVEPRPPQQNDNESGAHVMPPAGPHARGDLTNLHLTPGTGMLPDPDSDNPNLQPSS